MKNIAWGASKLLKMYLTGRESNPFEFCIDNFTGEKEVCGLPIKKSNLILDLEKGAFRIVIFAVSNNSLREIMWELNGMGLEYRKDFILYSDFFYDDFLKTAEKNFNFKFNPKFYQYALSYTLNSNLLIHTTILGSWLILELLYHLNNMEGGIAEVGAFEGGNALCGLQFMAGLNNKNFYIFDSFEGFPVLSENDPSDSKKGDYEIKTTFNAIKDAFAVFPEARVIKGFVPDTFNKIPEAEKFSLVFYDCDLYQPALDTFNFFWDKIIPGGYLVIHDYEAEEGGFTGVKKATNEFFADKNVKLFSFFENTMAVIKKE